MAKQKPFLRISEITGSVYIVTKYKDLGGGRFQAQEQFDITDNFRYVLKNELQRLAPIKEDKQ